MKKYLRKEVITPVVTLLFLLVYILEAMKLSAPVVNGVPQESFFPIIIVVIGVLAAGSLLVSGIKVANAEAAVEKEKKPVNYKPALVVAALAFLIAFFDTLGYAIVAPIFVFALMMIFDDKPQNWKKKAIISILVAIAVYALYTYVFDINFPQIWR